MVRITEIIIPCFNEEKRIVKTISKLKKLRPNYRVLFIDDGSTDLTTNVIIKEIDGCENMRVITLKKNQGKWGAVRTGALNVGRFA
jgi:glycosyltransferase involved in cell wall biosynthesis